MQEVLIIFMVFALVAIFVAFAYVIYAMQGKKRTESMRSAADQLGLEFTPQDQRAIRNQLGRFELFKLGGSPKVSNVLEAESDEVRIMIFDYSYTIVGVQHHQTVTQTVISAESDLLNKVPPFFLRPAKMVDNVAGKLGKKRIQLDQHGEFSKLVHLRSEFEEDVRAIFDIGLQEYLAAKKGITIELNRGAFLYYYQGRRVDAAALKEFLSGAYELFGLLADRGKNYRPQNTTGRESSFIDHGIQPWLLDESD